MKPSYNLQQIGQIAKDNDVDTMYVMLDVVEMEKDSYEPEDLVVAGAILHNRIVELTNKIQ